MAVVEVQALPDTPVLVSGNIVAWHSGDQPTTVMLDGPKFTLGTTSGRWTLEPLQPRYFAAAMEQHIRSDEDRGRGVRNVPIGQVNHARARELRAYLCETLARMERTPDQVFWFCLYIQDMSGFNVVPVVPSGEYTAASLGAALAAAGWPVEKEG